MTAPDRHWYVVTDALGGSIGLSAPDAETALRLRREELARSLRQRFHKTPGRAIREYTRAHPESAAHAPRCPCTAPAGTPSDLYA